MKVGWAIRTKASCDRPHWAETGVPVRGQYIRVTAGDGANSIYCGSAQLTLAEALHFRRGLSRAIRELRLRAEAQAREGFIEGLTAKPSGKAA